MESYNRTYLYGAKKNLANCFDYAINDQKINGAHFFSVFVNSEYSKLFAEGNPGIIAGMSGTELAMNILTDKMQIRDFKQKVVKEYRTREYWLGYYLAEYQWKSGMDFKEIKEFISYDDLINMYKIYHEMDVEQFIDDLNDRKNNSVKRNNVKLQYMRKKAKKSQSELSKLSGVNIRSIQVYEQNVNNIENAEYNTLKKLANALNCKVEDIVSY